VSITVVSMAHMEISADPAATLITYSLGSCIGVAAYDATRKVGALIHCMLPEMAIHPQKALQQPGIFVDSGLQNMFLVMAAHGCRPESLAVHAAGAGCMMDGGDAFRIGERNTAALHRILAARGIRLAAEDVGGNVSRKLSLQIGSGAVTVTSNGTERIL